MATSSCTPVRFSEFGLRKGELYFRKVGCDESDDDTGIESDSFQKGTSSKEWIKNKDDDFLVMDDGRLLFKELTKADERDPGCCTFTVKTYKSTEQCGGKPVTLCAKMGDHKEVVVCCSSNKRDLRTVEAVPDTIGDGGHEALFILKPVRECSGTFWIESSIYPEYFLRLEAPDTDPYSREKLVLHRYPYKEVHVDGKVPVDEPDEHCQFQIPI